MMESVQTATQRLTVFPPSIEGPSETIDPNSSRRKALSQGKKFLSPSGCLFACALMFSCTLALAQQPKTIVRHAVGYAVSKPLREFPIDVLGLKDTEAPEPRPIPLRNRSVQAPSRPDSVLQKEVRPGLAATKGVDFDGIGAN